MQSWPTELQSALATDRKETESKLAKLSMLNANRLLPHLELTPHEYPAALQAVSTNVGKYAPGTATRKFLHRVALALSMGTDQAKYTLYPWAVGPWEVEFGDKVSVGGFGEVFRGVWAGHGAVAAKVLLIDGASEEVKKVRQHPSG